MPRADGEIVVGATQEERDDRDVTAGAVHDLLRDAMIAVPAISELILAETNVGLRPGSRDNGPIVGRVSRGHWSSPPATSATASCCPRPPPTPWPRCWPAHGPDPAWAPFGPGRLG